MPLYLFAGNRLDADSSTLFRNGAAVSLRPKSFDVLHYLLRHPGRLVGRDELFESIWPEVVVTDDSLTQCLIEIRRALGDNGKEIIRTVPRRGYVFEADVEHVAAESSGQTTATPGESQRFPSAWTVAGLAALALALIGTWWWIASMPELSERAAAGFEPTPRSIAVLSFADMSAEGDQEYIADGIAEEILNLLAQIPELTVIGRTSSFSFKGRSVGITTIARQLNVAYLLEGSLRREGGRVRITAQLVNGSDGAHVWSRTFEERVDDVFALQDNIARAVAEVLEIEMLGESAGRFEVAPSTDGHLDPRVWELYARGRVFYGRRMEGDVMRAQHNFERALEIDPTFADAWVSLAATLNLRRYGQGVREDQALQNDAALSQMQAALEKALTLDPANAEALWRYSCFIKDAGDPDASLKQMGLAVGHGYNDALVQSMMGAFAREKGDLDAASKILGRAVALDPVSIPLRINRALLMYHAGKLDKAFSEFRKAVELNPELADDVRPNLTWLYIHQRDLESAMMESGRLPPGPARDQAEAMVHHLNSDRGLADEALNRLLERPVEQAAARLAYVYAVRGEFDQAFAWLEKAIDHAVRAVQSQNGWGGSEFFMLRDSPFLEPLHTDPRWAELMIRAEEDVLGDWERGVLAMLREHVRQNPGLYDQIGI